MKFHSIRNPKPEHIQWTSELPKVCCFPSRGFLSHRATPSSHPFLFGIFPERPSNYWGTFMTMEPPTFTIESWLVNKDKSPRWWLVDFPPANHQPTLVIYTCISLSLSIYISISIYLVKQHVFFNRMEWLSSSTNHHFWVLKLSSVPQVAAPSPGGVGTQATSLESHLCLANSWRLGTGTGGNI